MSRRAGEITINVVVWVLMFLIVLIIVTSIGSHL